jgi:hypothetical protein
MLASLSVFSANVRLISCRYTQAELLHTIAVANTERHSRARHRVDAGDAVPATGPPAGDETSRLAVRPREPDRQRDAEDMARRVRARRE